jgi:hypothetical protein
MAPSTHLFLFFIIPLAALWLLGTLGPCEATTVSLTSGPFSNSRRQAFVSRGRASGRSEFLPSLFDEDLDNESYKEVEECSVRLTTPLMKIFHSMFCDHTLLVSPSCDSIFLLRLLTAKSLFFMTL